MEILFARRPVKLNSWKDVVIYIVVGAALYGFKWLFEKKFPNVNEKIAGVITVVVSIALAVGLMFLLDVDV